MRLLLVVNPTASSVTPQVQAAITDALAVRHELAVVETSSRDHASTLARVATADGTGVVVVLAGDGTLNEAMQALVGTDTALAVLPGGSTNVLARTLGVAYDPLDACAQLLQSLDADRKKRVGVGFAHVGASSNGSPNGGLPDDSIGTSIGTSMGRAFLFHLGVGFDAAVVREMEERHAHLKRRYAHPAFAVATVETWLRRYDHTARIEVRATARDEKDVVTAVGPYAVISNSRPYTYVGRRPATLAPDASLDRALAATVFSTVHASLLLRAAASAVTRARFVGASRDIAQIPDVWRATLSSTRSFPWQVDGDYLGLVSHLDVSYRPDCLSLVVPVVRATPGRARG